jgi:transposase-like protein
MTAYSGYVYVDGVYLKRSWGGEIQNVSVLVAIDVNPDGYREILGAAEGMKEDHESWMNFFLWLKAIHSQEGKEAARLKAQQVAQKLREMKLKAAAKKVEDSIEETFTFMDFPSQH